MSEKMAGQAMFSPRVSSPSRANGGFQLPRQMQRALPVYIIVLVALYFLMIGNPFSSGDVIIESAVAPKTGRTPTDASLPGTLFPKKVWQTWKVDVLDFEERDLNCARTWTQKNLGYRYEVLTDANDADYVAEKYGPHGFNRPDIVRVYNELQLRIIKADLLRYLIMYADGGLYADIDVEALRPISRFIPERFNEHDIDMIIGIEIDQPEFAAHPILGPKSRSFCQWTFMCKPRLPVMIHLIDQILHWLDGISKAQGKPISEIHLDFDEVISGTGPSAFTEAIIREMKKNTGQEVAWDKFHAMQESTLVGGVLVLTVEAFAAGQGHSDSGNHGSRHALVKHHYHASKWPENHPRYAHPLLGEVERCNWDMECVTLWDQNKEVFESMSDEERAGLIAEKEANDRAQREKEEELERLRELALPADLDGKSQVAVKAADGTGDLNTQADAGPAAAVKPAA